jgi:parallel beta-helix repeat protein
MHNTIQQNDWYGIGCDDNSSPDIKACLIQNNASGIGCGSSVVLTVTDCIIADNDNHGIYGDVYGVYGGLNSQLTVSNSIIRFNGYHGIYLDCMLSTTIRNNWIHNNGCGIYITGQSVQPLVRNNTIVHNTGYGIYRDYFAPEPNISNCIIWENGAGQLYNCSATYSRTTDPNFMNPDDPNDLHIDVNSPCKNAGNPNSNYDGETDIDGEGRVKYGQVDIGGDEYYLSPADFDDDLTVNFFDYALFANVWQSNDPGFSLDGDNDVDYNDLALFCEDWLWQAGWAKSFTCGAGQSMIQTMATGFAPAAVSYPSVLAEQPIEKVEPIKIEQMIKWLEELWLDPEVRKLIDKDTWLKFIESVKEEL